MFITLLFKTNYFIIFMFTNTDENCVVATLHQINVCIWNLYTAYVFDYKYRCFAFKYFNF